MAKPYAGLGAGNESSTPPLVLRITHCYTYYVITGNESSTDPKVETHRNSVLVSVSVSINVNANNTAELTNEIDGLREAADNVRRTAVSHRDVHVTQALPVGTGSRRCR